MASPTPDPLRSFIHVVKHWKVAYEMTSSNEGMKNMNIPDGFEPCQTGSACPACNSSLIRKIAVKCGNNDDDKHRSATDTNIVHLRAAKVANLLLTALSFDASTRNSSSPKEASRIVSGVSYCEKCKVHVVVDPDELELLFPEDCDDEWLRGCLFVAVDDKEVEALLTTQNTSSGQSQLSRFDHIGPKKPQDFDYDYRHKVATKAMGSKMTKGYTLTEDICQGCEMPLMKNDNQAKECVVCPKLWLKIKEHDDSKRGRRSKTNTMSKADKDPDDTISAIIAEARRATEPRAKQKASSLDKILSQRFASSNMAASTSRTESTSHASMSTQDCPPHHYLENFKERSVSWDKLLVSGRLLSSKRLHQGWTFSERSCLGHKCNGTPLMRGQNSTNDVCMVCGGSGNGRDGYYASEKGKYIEDDTTEEEPDWEACLEKGRSLLTQRLTQGWTMDTSNCAGYQCNNMPLTKLGSDPSSCVVCGGTGSGCDGMYEQFRSAEVVDAERDLVSQEISHLMSMGWILKDSLCQQCYMPLVSEHEDSDDLCILCGKVPALNAPVADFSKDEVSKEAGKRLKMGWALPNAPLCNHCGGLQMIPPNSTEMECIMPSCASDTEPSIVHIGKGFNYSNGDKAVAAQCTDRAEVAPPRDIMQQSLYKEPSSFPFNYVGIPHNDEDPSVLSDDMSQTRSVASSALGHILEKLDDAKHELKVLSQSNDADPFEYTAKQIEIASLIEKIARACGQPDRG